MIRLVSYVVFSLALTLALTWLISQPGTILIDLGAYRLQPGIGISVIILILVILLAVLLVLLVLRLLGAPRAIAQKAAARRRQKGVEALSDGFIALQAGDAGRARQLAIEARTKLAGNVAAQLLQARANLALNEWGAAREEYRALLENPKTAIAALSGLYEQARAQKRADAALTFAHKAHMLDPALDWAGKAIFSDVIRNADWQAALEILNATPTPSKEAKENKKHKSALLHTAIAADSETTDPLGALEHARTALKMEPDFVPAALVAARIYSSRGEVRKATSLLRRLWRSTKHPHIATLFANAQPGISPGERLKRLGELIPSPPPDIGSALVLANTAIDAQQWSAARNALAKYAASTPSQGVCVAMAKIEEGQNADYGRARQWLARALNAPRDPIWTADGITANEWAPISPVTGEFDAFEWKIPTNAITIMSEKQEDGAELAGQNPDIETPGETKRSEVDGAPNPMPIKPPLSTKPSLATGGPETSQDK
ncbi:Uncharacterized protein EC-HemY in Proteobacteria (unrelated to HemY-type PPO in GramPositives) [hydrothermal vent metagenome]|uniref:Uncharacterized protein EC-HemY in Proteobacteria (Unrelated to HemY-type PPO in GramPositives) n=1 Tax=hydrothermal vent metagenome TaxID=652676 RepID=A0A3B0TCR2_9ZZZZ